jgi:hypothetical protein
MRISPELKRGANEERDGENFKVFIGPGCSKVFVPPEPFDLRTGIPVHDIAFFILEIPWDHNKDVPLPDPDFLFDLSLDPAHPCHAVETANPDMVCPHHQFGTPEHFPIAFLGQFDPDDLIARGCSRLLLCQYDLSSSSGFFRILCA